MLWLSAHLPRIANNKLSWHDTVMSCDCWCLCTVSSQPHKHFDASIWQVLDTISLDKTSHFRENNPQHAQEKGFSFALTTRLSLSALVQNLPPKTQTKIHMHITHSPSSFQAKPPANISCDMLSLLLSSASTTFTILFTWLQECWVILVFM